MATAICPACGDDIRVPGNIKLGQQVACTHCAVALEVVETEPVELDWSSWDEDADDEDWYDDDYDDDEDDDDDDF